MKELFSFTGRARRRDYWLSQLLYAVFYVVLITGLNQYNDLLTAIGGIAMLIGFVPVIAIQVKRFHDMDKSGAFVLINFIPYVGGIINAIWMGFFSPVNTVDNENGFGIDPRLTDIEVS